MKVLLTGATGLVGTELVSLLLKNGLHVNYLTTSEDKIQNEEKYTGFLWNPKKGEIDENCIDDVDAVIHLAGASISKRWTQSYKEEILESRIVSTRLLYTLLKSKDNKVSQFICASAIGIYPSSLEAIYSEDSTERDNSFLGTVVQKWEEAALQIEQLKIKVALIRTGLVLSGKGGVLKEMAAPVKFGLGAAFGSGEQLQSWIHLRDLAGIYYYVLNNELEGVYNAVAPYPVTQKQLVKTIAQVLDKPYFIPNIPRFAMQLAVGEMHTLLYDSQNVSAKKIIGEGYQFKYLSLEKAIKNELRS
ncbi:TIGR01777 family protein [Flavobacterium zepuense]|uniref:TIGR01777 family protein n=1 Tax=Flavobacterium zepuense TaxID=2593302 RepID=A0A552UYD8_9FLAO|nr:TIGR01777 family oxidoreductase [Flavobacterium zepuense]TRW23246.1 TIGR01777 family protein [Flavobacterium zepuense]